MFYMTEPKGGYLLAVQGKSLLNPGLRHVFSIADHSALLVMPVAHVNGAPSGLKVFVERRPSQIL